MYKQLRQVAHFHEANSMPILDKPTIPPKERCELRQSLIEEEVKEMREAWEGGDIVGVADAITDQLYVIMGTIHEFGLTSKINLCFDEVHNSNMSKLGEDGKPIKREDGKVLKGPNYFKPNLKSIIAPNG